MSNLLESNSLFNIVGPVPSVKKVYHVLEHNKLGSHYGYGKGSKVTRYCKCGEGYKTSFDGVQPNSGCLSCGEIWSNINSRVTTFAYLKEVDKKLSFGIYTHDTEIAGSRKSKDFLKILTKRTVVSYNYDTGKLYCITRTGKGSPIIKSLVSFTTLNQILRGYGPEFIALCKQRAGLSFAHSSYLKDDVDNVVALYRKPHYEVYLSMFINEGMYSDLKYLRVPEQGEYLRGVYNKLLVTNSGKEAKKVFLKSFGVRMSGSVVRMMTENLNMFRNLCYFSKIFGFDRAKTILDSLSNISVEWSSINEFISFVNDYGINRAFRDITEDCFSYILYRDAALQWAAIRVNNSDYVYRDDKISLVHDQISADYRMIKNSESELYESYGPKLKEQIIDTYTRTIDGIDFSPLTMGKEFTKSGMSWGNCVASYVRLVSKDKVVVTCYKQDEPYLCIELDAKKGKVIQAELPKRKPLSVLDYELVCKYMNSVGLPVQIDSLMKSVYVQVPVGAQVDPGLPIDVPAGVPFVPVDMDMDIGIEVGNYGYDADDIPF